MNIETINYINGITGYAADRLTSRIALKAVKAELAENMYAETTHYCNVDGVDFEAVAATVSVLLAFQRKEHFTNAVKTITDRMEEAREETVFNQRIECAIKIANRDHGVWLTRAQVAAWANGDVYFNCTKAAHELAHAAKEIKADESEYAETVMAEEAEAENVNAIATKAGLFDLWERIDAYNCRDLVNNLEMHYVAAYNDECAGGDATTAPQRLFGFNAGDTLRDVFRAVVGQAEEDLAILVEAAHAEALAIDAQKARNWSAFAGRNVFDTLSNADHRRKAIDAAHAEALAMNERHASADEMAREFIAQPEAPAKAKRVTRVKLLSTVGLANGTNERTYRIDLDNGRTYFYSDRCQVLQVRHKSRKQANKLVEIKSPYILRRVQDAIARFQA